MKSLMKYALIGAILLGSCNRAQAIDGHSLGNQIGEAILALVVFSLFIGIAVGAGVAGAANQSVVKA